MTRLSILHRRGLAAGLAALTIAVTVTACGGTSSDSASETARSGDTITIATDPTYPPFQYMENGEFTGLEVDTGRAIAEVLGKNVEFVNVKYTTGISALNANRFDVFMAGGTVDTPNRRSQVLLIDEYNTSPGLMVRKGNPENLGTKASLCGRTVSVFGGSEFENTLKAVNAECGNNPISILALSDANGPYDAVRTGRADAYWGNVIQASYQAPKFDADAVKVTDGDNYLAAFMVKKDNVKLAQELAQGLQKIIDSGQYAEIAAKYNVPASELVTQATINGGDIPVSD